ncbi:amino acid adenylation domain-containing protein [Amycolatopsis marina]|uniref:Amino acid adenylation domain-containing protein n=1 Tax=Amycolatopsis marina TaxID=490629 RepID=A0A1I1B5M5_9PSEU|nr:non-ribosomal peptide synthetase/MFS transporter [Amycolatopsis marina]SFB44018.1 amino acid adenylation domain-containing protein [Amycolatopsis marina]
MTTVDDTTSAAARRALLERRLRRRAEPAATITRRPDGDPVPLSYQQERVWFMEQFAPGTTSYNIPVPIRLTGRLDTGAIRSALDALPARHEALRMRFPAGVDGQPAVHIEPRVSVPLTVVAAEDEQAARAIIDATAAETFDLATGPLLRATLVRLSEDEHLLAVCTHHIVGDGWSVDLLLRDLAVNYHASCAGGVAELPGLPIGYGDFAHWQRRTLAGDVLDRQLEHWRGQLDGVRPLELPTDRPRPATQSFDGALHEFFVERELTTALGELSRQHGATLFMTLLTAYQLLLSRYSGQDDFAVGSSSAGRGLPELEGVVGMFINMLPLRAQLGGDSTFVELLSRTRRHVLDAFEHADVPFERLVHALGVPRDVSRSPVFQAMFVLQNYEMGRMPAVGTSDVDFRWLPMDLPATRFDFEFHAIEVSSGMIAKFVYNTALFDEATVARMAGQLTTLLRSIVAAPGRRVSQLDILDADERALVLRRWNETATEFPQTTLSALVREQVERTPDAVAVTFRGESLSYREVDRRANRLGNRLRGLGVEPGVLVGVCAQRSVDLVVALLGVLKAGGAYVPLDPEYPADRLAFMVADAAAPVVLTQAELRGVLPQGDATLLVLDDAAEVAALAEQPDSEPGRPAGPDDTAYVIYTSGSTGRPKGVPNGHRGIVNRLDWMQRAYRLDETDAVLQKTPASFDVSVWEFFWPLITGARLVLAEPGGHKDAAYLRELLVTEAVTTAHFVPSMLTLFLGEPGLEHCTSLRRVVCSGEELPLAAAREFTARLPHCELHNLYGPTEAAIDVTAWHCTAQALAEATAVPIGSPIQNIRVYVLDPHGSPCPVGVAGELHIAGVGLAKGYHQRPELTAAKFVPDPFGGGGAKMYRTGDLARWRPDGTIDFLGRLDHQVKLRGLRIELGEIESALREQPGVRDATVIVREDTPGDKRLVGYLAGEADPAALRTALKQTLPDYMVPPSFVVLDELPLTPNGKLDRKALPAPVSGRDSNQELVAPATPAETMLAAIWADVLKVDELGVDDDFFDLGGHSMLATQVVARIGKECPAGSRQVGVMDLFQNRTIRELATFMGGDADDGPRRLLYELTRPVPPDERTRTYVCFPYGGGSAIVYQPLADALPKGNSLYSVAIPGHDVGLSEEAVPFDELVERLAGEILERIEGPLAIYGHCGVGNALAVGVARRLEEQGRELEVVYIGAIFPFARLKGMVGTLRTRLERLRSNQFYSNWLKGMGVDTDDLDPEQADRIISNMRADGRAAEEYFSQLLDRRVDKLRAPIVSVVGSEDPVTDYYAERYREWEFLTDTTALVVLDQAGHFFLRYRADELAEIVTAVHPAVREGATGESGELHIASRGADAAWALHDTHRTTVDDKPTVRPSMGRFVTITIGQLVSSTGSALTSFAVPIWLYTKTGSVTDLGLLWALALLCGVLILPLAGALVDRGDRRRIMIAASAVAGSIQLVLAVLLTSGYLHLWYIYLLIPLGSVAGSFQRIAYQSSIAQLVPKQYLGHAMGLAQLSNGFAMLLMPVIAAGLLAAIELKGILILDMASYVFAIVGLLLVRFPDLLGWRPREPLLTAITNGLRYSWNHRGFRTMLMYFALANVFLAPALVLVTPLVLSFGSVTDVARVALAEAIGAVAGGVGMALWGGPRHRRMIGVLLGNVGIATGCFIMGLHPSVTVAAIGVFLLAMAMSVSQGIYATLVQVKVPQRFHGRVFAFNQTITWSTLPIGFAVLAPLAVHWFEPLLQPGGTLAGSVGELIGTGTGRGIGFAFVVFALLLVSVNLGGFCLRLLRRFDTEVPDSLPDDLVGAQERERKLAATTAGTQPQKENVSAGRVRV